MRRVLGLPYALPDRGASQAARNEQRHFNLWLEEISERAPHVMGVDDLAGSGEGGPTLGDPVRTTVEWAVAHAAPVCRGVISKIALTYAGTKLVKLLPLGASLLPPGGVWLRADDVETDDA